MPAGSARNCGPPAGTASPSACSAAYNDLDEARFIAERTRSAIETGGSPGDVAVLYRSNAQSRVIEEALTLLGIPYRIHGGFRFFERAEIKNALSYMRLIHDRHADPAFERVVNTPPRGIGEKTVEVLRREARERSVSLWQACKEAIVEARLPGRAAGSVGGFLRLIDDLAEACADLELHRLTERVIGKSGLLEFHGREPGERGLARKENLQELVNAARQFTGELVFPLQDDDAAEVSMLQEFLDQTALDAGETQAGSGPAVQLMTLHSAKGLEFPTVFLSGLDEGVFPHRMSAEEHGRLEEERRLCYVGMTRAMRQLYLTHAETRRLHGSDSYNRRSRFVDELPQDLVEEVRTRTGGEVRFGVPRRSGRQLPLQEDGALRIGQRVHHAKFGDGYVLHCEGAGERARVQVNFTQAGEKWLMYGYANLQPLD